MEMEESPPPVPPKDPGYKSSMDGSIVSSAAASGSKRKREQQDDTIYNVRDGRLEAADMDFTPTKKARSNAGTSDGDAYHDETHIQRSVRRKKGLNDLSRLNLRHAASMSNMPPRNSSPTRESKFQEGSLNDKPSEKPPSVYTRITRTDSGSLELVDQLMTDYHEGMPTPTDSVKAALDYEKAMMPHRVAEINAHQKKEEGGMFRFGKSIAAAFHPVSLWNRLWSEQKDELAREGSTMSGNCKAQLKEEVEARYAEMKNSGQFHMQPVSLHTPHDSGIALNAPFSTQDRGRTTSFGSMVQQGQEDYDSRAGSEVPESVSKPLRGIRSRLHLRKPSLQNLKNGITGGLKRVASDMNLAGAADRESSSSASPTKTEFGSALRHAHSRQDLKRQRRLSKRVSDLESKLNKARLELDDALVAASPMPKLGNKYERFTPVGTVRRPKFVPGALATLPSEGVLFPERAGSSGGDQASSANPFPRRRKALDLSKAFDNIDDEEEEEDEETVKAPRGRPYPVNAKELFGDSQQTNGDHQSQENAFVETKTTSQKEPTSELTEFTEVSKVNSDVVAGAEEDEEPSSPIQPSTDVPDIVKNDGEKTIKASKKSGKSKKRSSMKSDDKMFRPGAEDDDDAEWEEAAQPKKKRKSTGKDEVSQPKKRATTTKPKSPASRATKKATSESKSPKQVKEIQEKSSDIVDPLAKDEGEGEESEDELTKAASARASMISNPESLEPVYEEEEEITITTVPLKDVPSKPTAKATPARFGRNAVRSRSNSPQKHVEKVEVIVEEKIMARAGQAAQDRRGSRSSSPPPAKITDPMSITPGIDNVPALPKATKSTQVELTPKKKRPVMAKENFEWPDDVF